MPFYSKLYHEKFVIGYFWSASLSVEIQCQVYDVYIYGVYAHGVYAHGVYAHGVYAHGVYAHGVYVHDVCTELHFSAGNCINF